MKKYLIPVLLFIIIMPFMVNAETCDIDKITIKNISIKNKTDNVEELDKATASDKSINLYLSMSDVGDNIEYKFIVKNDSNEDYELDKTSLNLSSDYIDYSFETGDNSNIVKANSSKTVTLRVEYKNEVPEGKFENGSYNDNKTVTVQLSSRNNIIKNPKTGVQSYILILIILLLISGTIYVLLRKKKYTKLMILIIGATAIIPISVYALCKCEINIESNILITKGNTCVSFAQDDWNIISLNIKRGNDDCYHVGDTKTVEIENYGTHTVRIANMSTPDECSNNEFSQTACGFVVEFADIINKTMMNSTITNEGGWGETSLRTFVNADIYNALPIKLRNIIIDTKVVSGHSYNDTNSFTMDKVYLLSGKEIWKKEGSAFLNEFDSAWNSTRQLDYYSEINTTTSNYSVVIKRFNNINSSWWLRTALYNNNDDFWIVLPSGSFATSTPTDNDGVSPAFRIG